MIKQLKKYIYNSLSLTYKTRILNVLILSMFQVLNQTSYLYRNLEKLGLAGQTRSGSRDYPGVYYIGQCGQWVACGLRVTLPFAWRASGEPRPLRMTCLNLSLTKSLKCMTS